MSNAPKPEMPESLVRIDRRAATLSLGAALASVVASCGGARAPAARGGGESHEQSEDEIPATEDLMREHGVLRRILGVYDEVVRRVRANGSFDPALVVRAARLIRTFAEDYHERAEERWVFPVVRRTAALAETVDVLLAQHRRGREVTDAITRLASQGVQPRGEAGAQLATLCEAFDRMYRAHAAREDTVIFPSLRHSLSHHEFGELGERMEDAERTTVGEGGFERAVIEVSQIERGLGIDDLAQFTPPEPSA